MPTTSWDWCVICVACEPSAPWLLIPAKETVSDSEFLIARWLVASGDTVRRGDTLVEVETSKAAMDLESETDGVVYFTQAAGSRVALGSPIAIVAAVPMSTEEVGQLLGPGPPPGSTRFSARARAVLAGTGLTERDFDGGGLITEAMVRERIAGSATGSERDAPPAGGAPVDGSLVVIVGAGGHAATMVDLLTELRSFRIAGLLDDTVAVGGLVAGHPILGTLDELPRLRERGIVLVVNAIAGIGDRGLRERVWSRIKGAGCGVPTLVHPRAVVDLSAVLAEGAQILAGAYVGARAFVDEDAIVNSHAVVSHDCRVGAHAHVAPNATLAGDVQVGVSSLIGMGSTTYLGVRIGREAVVANGTSVLVDVPDYAVARRDIGG